MRMSRGLIGRDSELSQLCRLVDPPPVGSKVRALLGEPGMGKTALLTAVIGTARSAGLRVLTVAGSESERVETLLSAGSPAALGFAATVAYQSGAPADRAAVLLALDRLAAPSPGLRQWV